MERVVQSLIDNAVNTTPEGGQIMVGLEAKNNQLIFKIENIAPILSEDLLQWINNSYNKNGQYINKPGSGLGLSVTKKILALHNSLLHAYSSENNRNVFTFGIEIYNRNKIA